MSDTRSMSEREDDRRRALLHGLLGDAHLSDYQSSAYFRATVDRLATLLPLWMDGIAKMAAERDRDFRDRVEAAKMTMPKLVLTEEMLRDIGWDRPAVDGEELS